MVKECTLNKFEHANTGIFGGIQNPLDSKRLVFHAGTVTSALLKSKDLFKAEVAHQLPLRVAFLRLLACCDSKGLFSWQPALLKCKILSYDDVDFSQVLDALLDCGLIKKYEQDGALYGCLPLGDYRNFSENCRARIKHSE